MNTRTSRLSVWAGATLLALAACTAAAPQPEAYENELSWADLVDRGLPKGADLAVFISAYPDASEQQGHVAFVDREGKTKFLTTEAHDASLLVAGSNGLCVTTKSETLQIRKSGAGRSKREGYAGSGHWSGVLTDGTCVTVLNSGVGSSGYETDVNWHLDGREMHSVVPAIPGPTGQSPDAIWVRDIDITAIPGTSTLFRTDLRSGLTERAMAWSTRVEDRGGEASDIYFSDDYVSDMFWYRDKLHFLEDATAGTKEGTRAEIRPGYGNQTRLATVDPVGQTYESTLLAETRNGLFESDGQGGSGNGSAIAMRRSHLYDGALYTTNAEGQILAVDLRSRKMRSTGLLSTKATKASEAVAAWRHHQLTLVLVSEDRSVTREDYDLRTGQLTQSVTLEDFSPVLGDQSLLSSAALLD